MRPIIKNLDLDDVDDNSVFENQIIAGAGLFTLNGSGVVDGEWIISDGFARKISFKSLGDISATTLTITGYSDLNKTNLITEDVTGPNNETVVGTKYFAIITSISGNVGIGISIQSGFSSQAVTAALPINWRNGIASVNLDITGTMNVTVQNTFDKLQDLNNLDFSWQDSSIYTLVSTLQSVSAFYEGLPSALRLKVNSYNSGAECKLTIRQTEY